MSLQVWLPLNKNEERQGWWGFDMYNQGLANMKFQSDYDGALTFNSASTKMGGSYKSTSASEGNIVSSLKILLGKNQSMFCWVKVNSFNASSNLTAILGQHRYTHCTGMGITMKTVSATTGYLSVNTGDGNSGRTYNTYCGNTLLQANTWYHVGYTYNGSTIKLYVNGKLDGTHNVSNIAVPEDYFQVFGWSFSNGIDVYEAYQLIGEICDVRAYDHTLSLKEVKEVAKGLMLQYNFRKAAEERFTDNLAPYPTPGSSAVSAGWDTSLHANAINVAGWSNGYNGGVPSPAIGFHAHWELRDGLPTMVFPKLNYKISGISATRWLGIHTASSFSSYFNTTGDQYCISFEAMADSPGRAIKAGYYYNDTFPDGYVYAENIPVGHWKKYTFSMKMTTALTKGGHFYFYGHDTGGNGTAYVRNIQIATDITETANYAPSRTARVTRFRDCSGFNHNAINSTNHTVGFISETGKNIAYKELLEYINNPNNYIQAGVISIPDSYTMVWTQIQMGEAGHYLDWRATSGEAGVQPFYFNGSQIQYYSSGGGSVYFNYTFNTEEFYDIAIAVTATTATLYVNGIKQQTISATNPPGTLANFHVFARCSLANIPASAASFGSLKIYATTLSDADILAESQMSAAIDKSFNLFTEEFKER